MLVYLQMAAGSRSDNHLAHTVIESGAKGNGERVSRAPQQRTAKFATKASFKLLPLQAFENVVVVGHK